MTSVVNWIKHAKALVWSFKLYYDAKSITAFNVKKLLNM